ncbi:hypothetical protein D9M69_580600 [compost metagenome]
MFAGSALRTGQTGSLSARRVATANSNTADMVRRASAATVGAPRFAVFCRISRTWAGVISRTGMLPILGNTTRSSISRRRFLVTSSQSFVCSHSLATISKVFFASLAFRMRSSCLCWAGLMPCLTSLRAASLRSLASESVTAGYSPSANMLALPFSVKRYRQALTPLGLTSR